MQSRYDIAVIGGGINGAGIARDAALRGLSVLLLDKNDFGSGTTSWSSRLIHGGLRYLEYGEIPLVFESLHERRRLRRMAGHLVEPLQLTIPIYKDGRRSKFIIRLGMLAYDLLSFGKRLPRHTMLSREDLLADVPGLNAERLVGGARYFDAQVTYAERLVIENIMGAREAGADVRNYSPVIGINVRQRDVHSLQFIDRVSGEEVEVGARVIINAAGPWVDRVLATVNREMPVFMGGTKGSHIVTGPFPGAPSSAFYVEARADGRPFFIIPWNDQYLVGTTDIRYEGDPGDVVASDEEIDYLLSETNHVFPQAALGRSDLHYAYAGVRPLPKREKGPESAITRKHIILRHRKAARGLISIIGGKLTTYRNLAEQSVNKALKVMKRDAGPCLTRELPLPGGARLEEARTALASDAEVSPECASRLIGIYGSRALAIVDRGRHAGAIDYVDDDQTILTAEVDNAFADEFCVSLVDLLHRRTMLGLRADQGASVTPRLLNVAAAAAGWDAAETERQRSMLESYNARMRVPRD